MFLDFFLVHAKHTHTHTPPPPPPPPPQKKKKKKITCRQYVRTVKTFEKKGTTHRVIRPKFKGQVGHPHLTLHHVMLFVKKDCKFH